MSKRLKDMPQLVEWDHKVCEQGQNQESNKSKKDFSWWPDLPARVPERKKVIKDLEKLGDPSDASPVVARLPGGEQKCKGPYEYYLTVERFTKPGPNGGMPMLEGAGQSHEQKKQLPWWPDVPARVPETEKLLNVEADDKLFWDGIQNKESNEQKKQLSWWPDLPQPDQRAGREQMVNGTGENLKNLQSEASAVPPDHPLKKYWPELTYRHLQPENSSFFSNGEAKGLGASCSAAEGAAGAETHEQFPSLSPDAFSKDLLDSLKRGERSDAEKNKATRNNYNYINLILDDIRLQGDRPFRAKEPYKSKLPMHLRAPGTPITEFDRYMIKKYQQS